MATYERDRHQNPDREQENNRPNQPFEYNRDIDSDFPIFNFSRSYERDRMRSARTFRANDDRDDSFDDYRYEPHAYMSSVRPYEGLVGELSPIRRGKYDGRGPEGYTRSDARIYDDVNDHLTQHSYIDTTEITVSVKDGEVTLEGTVPDRDQKAYAQEVAADVHGVNHIINRLKIQKPRNDLTENKQ